MLYKDNTGRRITNYTIEKLRSMRSIHTTLMNLNIHRVSKKLCQCYFLNNSVKHWPTLIICGMQHHKETRREQPYCCCTTL